MDWRSGKLFVSRDPPFTRPQQAIHEEEGEEEEEGVAYSPVPPVRASASNNHDSSNSSQSPFADSNRYAGGHSQASGPTPSAYTPAPQVAGRPSMDAYGAFSDPAPSGFGTSRYNQVPSDYTNGYSTASPVRSYTAGPPILPEPDLGPMVSRTMQYADPYAAVRASIAGQPASGSPTSMQPMPPSYETYEGYR